MKSNQDVLTAEYKEKLAGFLGCLPDDIFLYWKGRVALYAILKAMGVEAGDEVILQGYTCVVVANAILYLGATPVYVDIDLATFNMNMDQLHAKINPKTKAIICQNTYGLSSHLEEISSLAGNYGIYTVEDCTHGFGGQYNGKPNGSYCDASFFSTQWSKPFSTGIGGFSVIHNPGLKAAVRDMERYKIAPSSMEIMNLRALYFARQYIINDLTYWPMVKLYRILSQNNLVVGSSSGGEIDGTLMPEGYFKDISACQVKKGLKEISALNAIQLLRKQNASRYTEFLQMQNRNHVDRSLFANHMFLRYPLLVNDREAFQEAAYRERIIIGDWFDSPIYPVKSRLETWKFSSENAPVAMDISRKVVNLPTEIRDVERVIEFLNRNIENILPG